jgi:hypothetical protein
MEEESNNVEQLPTEDGVYVSNILDTLEIPEIENPDEKEQEQIEIEEEGGK